MHNCCDIDIICLFISHIQATTVESPRLRSIYLPTFLFPSFLTTTTTAAAAAAASQIMLSSYHGHLHLVRLLIRHGADPNTLNDRGQSPLAGAVFKNEEEVIKALLEGVRVTIPVLPEGSMEVPHFGMAK